MQPYERLLSRGFFKSRRPRRKIFDGRGVRVSLSQHDGAYGRIRARIES